MRSNSHGGSWWLKRRQGKGALAVVGKVSMCTEMIKFFLSYFQPFKMRRSHQFVMFESLGDTYEGLVSMGHLVRFGSMNGCVEFNVNKCLNTRFIKSCQEGMIIDFLLSQSVDNRRNCGTLA